MKALKLLLLPYLGAVIAAAFLWPEPAKGFLGESSRIGLLFGVLTLITGSLFANIMWGTWWNWDPRESSYLLLVFLYAAYLFLRSAVEDPERRARMSAAYALFAAVLMPF